MFIVRRVNMTFDGVLRVPLTNHKKEIENHQPISIMRYTLLIILLLAISAIPGSAFYLRSAVEDDSVENSRPQDEPEDRGVFPDLERHLDSDKEKKEEEEEEKKKKKKKPKKKDTKKKKAKTTGNT